MNQDRGILLRR